MDRYTQHDRFGHFVPLASAECGEWTLAGKFEKRLYGDAASRLAAYEDTGLTPGDVKDLQELCKENGLAKYVDLIVEAKRQMGISNEHSIAQDEENESLQSQLTEVRAENARLRAERDKAVEDLTKLATKPITPCHSCSKTCVFPASLAPELQPATWCRDWQWRGTEGKA